jgi:large subunit ribosomal protein L29
MKSSEIRELSVKEIQERIENEEVFHTRQKLNHAISPLDNPLKIRHARRNLARLKTIMREKENEANKQS